MKILIRLSMFLLFATQLVVAQGNISGVVSDNDGLPLPGATIIIQGTSTGVTTDFDGNFSLEVGAEGVSIEVSFVGFAPQTIVVDSSDLLITLSSNLALEEVVVTSYVFVGSAVASAGAV